jgi:epoxyqueuosine reductase
MFAGTSIKRIGRDRFLRNVLIAIGNSADPALIGTARDCLDDAAPLVRAAAVWAFARLAGEAAAKGECSRRLPGEPDPIVREEWGHWISALTEMTN